VTNATVSTGSKKENVSNTAMMVIIKTTPNVTNVKNTVTNAQMAIAVMSVRKDGSGRITNVSKNVDQDILKSTESVLNVLLPIVTNVTPHLKLVTSVNPTSTFITTTVINSAPISPTPPPPTVVTNVLTTVKSATTVIPAMSVSMVKYS
jgi:hypothetical protein